MNPEEILILNPAEIQKLLTIEECIEAVEQAFRLYGEGEAPPPAVLSMHIGKGGFHVKAGFWGLERGYFAAKVNGNFPDNPARFGLPTIQGVVVLCDAEKGMPLAIMDSRHITALRTGAATAVAAKYLARANSHVVTVCGCSTQGRVQVRALARVRPIKVVFAYDRSAEQVSRFTSEIAAELNITATSVSNLAEVVRQSDICVTCTTSREPLINPEDVAPGSFIAAVGADSPHKREIHPRLMANCKIVCDLVEQCAVMGDLHHALEAGVMTCDDVHAELSAIVAGNKPGRESDTESIIFDSTGMALQDVAAAALLYEKAERSGRGVRLNFAA
jgi:alanine dehydrogenase